VCLAGAGGGYAQAPVGDVFAADAAVRGSVVLTGGGTRVLAGSTVSAGAGAATLRLARGGEVRVCPGTSVTVGASPSGRELSLGMGTGAVELHYQLAAHADTIQTPDFRMLLVGPGTFHLAVSADARGNACVRSLPANAASVIVTEMMGDGTYQVRPGDQVVFQHGHVAEISLDVPPDCGCPALPGVKRAQNDALHQGQPAAATRTPDDGRWHEVSIRPRDEPPQTAPSASLPLPMTTPPALLAPASSPATVAATQEPTAPLPPQRAGALHVQVDAPFVFSAAAPDPPPITIARVRLDDIGRALQISPTVSPPPTVAAQATAAPVKKGFFARVRGLFAAMFK